MKEGFWLVVASILTLVNIYGSFIDFAVARFTVIWYSLYYWILIFIIIKINKKFKVVPK